VARYTVIKRLCATGSLMDHALPKIRALIESGGQVTLGTVKPITNAAVAHDGQKTLVMLRKKKGELVTDLLERLENAMPPLAPPVSASMKSTNRAPTSATKCETAGRQHGLDVTLTHNGVTSRFERWWAVLGSNQ
jgi:hypothetical protein